MRIRLKNHCMIFEYMLLALDILKICQKIYLLTQKEMNLKIDKKINK